jgi:hypothetical protein
MAKKLTPTKAKEILRDGTVHGKPLTGKQKRFFGWMSQKHYHMKPYLEGGGGIIADDGTGIVYAQDGPVAHAGPGYEGLGYSNSGYNYNSAWGGRFQTGGKVINKGWFDDEYSRYLETNQGGFLQPDSKKLPSGVFAANVDRSSELASSIGGEDGELAYLIPTFKYGLPLKNPKAEYYRTGEYLGGPFKTYQEADEWERNVRHPYVEKGVPIPSPLRTWGVDQKVPSSKKQMGGSVGAGSLPGATGMMYARTGSTYRDKKEAGGMLYYEQGLDWQPKSMQSGGAARGSSSRPMLEILPTAYVTAKKPKKDYKELPVATVKGKTKFQAPMSARDNTAAPIQLPNGSWANAGNLGLPRKQLNKMPGYTSVNLDAYDAITDYAQFIPGPAGKLAETAGMAIDAYQAYDAFKHNRPIEGAINTASALLPMLPKSSYKTLGNILETGYDTYQALEASKNYYAHGGQVPTSGCDSCNHSKRKAQAGTAVVNNSNPTVVPIYRDLPEFLERNKNATTYIDKKSVPIFKGISSNVGIGDDNKKQIDYCHPEDEQCTAH